MPWPTLTPLLVLGHIVTHAVLFPWTKVEESFNAQAMHDVWYYGTHVDKYDHNEFPGVVPRTFVGALIVAIVSYPAKLAIGAESADKYVGLIVVRATLGLLVFLSWYRLYSAVFRIFGQPCARWYCLITISQFHWTFYASRPLPNTFAMCTVLIALASYIDAIFPTTTKADLSITSSRSPFTASIIWATIGATVLRCELVVLYAPFFAYLWLERRLTIKTAVCVGLAAAVGALVITVPIDSYMWQKWIWPEAHVLYFNAVLNKSAQWGTQPYLWYFYSALPRAMGVSVVLPILSMMVDRRVLRICVPCFVFVLLYSILPHKELRFVLYVVPVLNIAAAVTCQRIFQNRGKSFVQKLFAYACVFHLFINVGIQSLAVYTASYNYAGGDALWYLHRNVDAAQASAHPTSVYIDNYCAQTGVTRWLHQFDNWTYNKTENLSVADIRNSRQFGYLVIGDVDDVTSLAKRYSPRYSLWFTMDAFVGWDRGNFMDVLRKATASIHLDDLLTMESFKWHRMFNEVVGHLSQWTPPSIRVKPTVAVLSYMTPGGDDGQLKMMAT